MGDEREHAGDVEARPYGPEATQAERDLLRSRVSIHSEGVILYREIPIASAFSTDLMVDRTAELAAGWERFALLIDLREGRKADAPTRARITDRVSQLPGLERIVLVTGGRVMLNIGLRFMFPRLPGIQHAVCKSMDEALRLLADRGPR